MRSLKRKAAGGMAWTGLGEILNQCMHFIVFVILARLLTPADFGTVGAVGILIAFMIHFSQMGVGAALVQRKILSVEHCSTAFTFTMIISILMGIGLFLNSAAIASFFKNPLLESIVPWLVLSFLLRTNSFVSQSILQRELQFKSLVMIELMGYFMGYGLVGVLMAYYGYGVWSLVCANLTYSASTLLLYFYMNKSVVKLGFDYSTFRELITFGGWITWSKTANVVALQGDNLVVGRFLGESDLGLYTRAYQLTSLPANLFGKVVDRVLFPLLAQIQDDVSRISKIYLSTSLLIAYLAFPCTVVVFLLADEVVLLIFGENWLGMAYILKILVFGLYFRVAYKFPSVMFRSTGKLAQLAGQQTLYAILIVAAALMFVSKGVNGVAYGIVSALAIFYLVTTYMVIRAFKVDSTLFILAHLKPLIYSIYLFLAGLLSKEFLGSLGLDLITIVITLFLAMVIYLILPLLIIPKWLLGDLYVPCKRAREKIVGFVVSKLMNDRQTRL